jgi:hypothetical protein
MKTLKFLALISLIFLLPCHSYSATLGALRISLIDGDVQIKTEDTEEWVPASINMPLKDGDQIWVPEGSRAEVQINDGTSLRLDQNSALDILTLEKDSFQFYLNEGHIYVNFIGLKGSLLQIDTAASSARAYDRSIFRIDVSEDGYTEFSVYRGSLYAENRDGRTKVEEGNTLSLREGTYAELAPLGPSDEWEKWNRERDRKFAERRTSYRYLPNELQAYSTDFEENGKWVYVREYGYVWTPRVVISAEWAPYRIGRWVWRSGDYVWVSYEPWGWAPYHYGRWSFVASIGWFWVPPIKGAVYWGPGFVGWVQTPTYVSWVPLAPGEIYYGHGYYGPHSVNITNINITNINITKVVYKNIHVHNAITLIHHDTFVTGRHVDVNVRENPFLRERIHIGRPDIKPQRATIMPVVKEIPQAKRPPVPIREIKVKELKESRPFVRDRNASVLTPASPPKILPLKTREGIERPKPMREEVGKPKATREGIEKPETTRKGIVNPQPMKEGTEKPKATRGEIEKPKPIRESIERPKSTKAEVEKPKVSQPVVRGVEKPRESRPLVQGTQKSKEPKRVEKRMETPLEPKPSGKEAGKPGS